MSIVDIQKTEELIHANESKAIPVQYACTHCTLLFICSYIIVFRDETQISLDDSNAYQHSNVSKTIERQVQLVHIALVTARVGYNHQSNHR